MKLARIIKISHHITSRRSRVKTLTRLFKVRLYRLLIIKRNKKSIRIQSLLAHSLIERVAGVINSDLYDELSLNSEYKNKKTITQS